MFFVQFVLANDAHGGPPAKQGDLEALAIVLLVSQTCKR
jgi:hypothetical protein